MAWVEFETRTTEFHADGLTGWAISPWVELALRDNFVLPPQFHLFFSITFNFGYCLHQSPYLFSLKFSWGNHISVVEWTETYNVHHWRILWSSHRKLTWVGFEHRKTVIRSSALSHWAIILWVELALRANFIQPLQFYLHISYRLLSSSVSTFILIKVLLWYSHERSGMNWYIWYSRLKDSLKYLYKTGPRWIWTHDHLIFFRHSNLLSYQAMSSTHTQSQLGTATPISSFAQCQVLLRLMSSSVATLF